MRTVSSASGLLLLFWGVVFLFAQQMEVFWYGELPWLSNWMTHWSDQRAVFHPPEWAAFSLCSVGFVLMVFSIGLPERKARPPILQFISPQR